MLRVIFLIVGLLIHAHMFLLTIPHGQQLALLCHSGHPRTVFWAWRYAPHSPAWQTSAPISRIGYLSQRRRQAMRSRSATDLAFRSSLTRRWQHESVMTSTDTQMHLISREHSCHIGSWASALSDGYPHKRNVYDNAARPVARETDTDAGPVADDIAEGPVARAGDAARSLADDSAEEPVVGGRCEACGPCCR